MNSMMLSGAASLMVTATFGYIALRHWRSTRTGLIDALGLRWDRSSALDLLAGLVIASIAMLVIFYTEYALNAIARTASDSSSTALLTQNTAIMTVSTMIEELLNRGLLLSGLVLALKERKLLAVLVSAIFFGLLHALNPGASALSVLGNTLGGMIYGAAFVLSGRLWLSIGLHFAWNFMQGPILGFPVSGLAMGGLQHIQDLGPAWLSGGAYGPEGGLVGIASRFLVAALLLIWIKARSKS